MLVISLLFLDDDPLPLGSANSAACSYVYMMEYENLTLNLRDRWLFCYKFIYLTSPSITCFSPSFIPPDPAYLKQLHSRSFYIQCSPSEIVDFESQRYLLTLSTAGSSSQGI